MIEIFISNRILDIESDEREERVEQKYITNMLLIFVGLKGIT